MGTQGLAAIGKGAATGATMGSAFGPIGAAIGAGVGGLTGGVSQLVSNALAKKQQKKLQEDLVAMDNGNLGMTSGQKSQIVADATRTGLGQLASTQQQIARDSLAGSPNNVGAYQAAISDTAGKMTGLTAAANAKAQDLSQQQAQARRAEILRRLDAGATQERADRTSANEMGELSGRVAAGLLDKYNADILQFFGLGGAGPVQEGVDKSQAYKTDDYGALEMLAGPRPAGG